MFLRTSEGMHSACRFSRELDAFINRIRQHHFSPDLTGKVRYGGGEISHPPLLR